MAEALLTFPGPRPAVDALVNNPDLSRQAPSCLLVVALSAASSLWLSAGPAAVLSLQWWSVAP